MAELNYDRATEAAPGLSPLGAARVLRLAGAALSASLVVGVGVWGYKLAMRQIHGIPVLTAAEGPARTAPENPGGELADHQGLAVNQIAALGEAQDSAEVLRLAPRSVDLSAEDTASVALRASLGAPLAAPAALTGSGANGGAASRQVEPSETMRAVQPRSQRIPMPLPDEAAEPIFDPSEALIEAMAMIDPSELVDATEPGITRSIRPRARPNGDLIAEAAAFAVAAALAPGGTVDVDPLTLPTGTALAQIGSYDTEARAKLEWDKVATQYGALMEGKNRVIQAAESGGQTFYRLRVAGFASKDEARRFCAALQTGGQCVPTLVR